MILDWLLGVNKIGWLKTALSAGCLGMIIALILSGGNFEYDGNKYYLIFLGVPILWFIKRAYWRSRAESILALIDSGKEYRKELESVLKWNPDLGEELKFQSLFRRGKPF